MTRLALPAALAGLALGLAAASPAAPRLKGPSDPARVQVSADEFTLALSRLKLKRGPAIVQMVNYGEDDHDLALRRPGGRTLRIRTVTPGALGELETKLAPGRYTLWCTLADHRARGMFARLVVR